MSENTKNITEKKVRVVETPDVDVIKQTTENNTIKKVLKSVTDKTEDETGDYQGNERNSDDELNGKFPILTFKEGTERYVVTADGVPQFYTQTIEEARNRMWDIARISKFKDSDYNSYIREFNDENHIQVVGFYKFFVISYERVLCYLNVQRVQEIQKVPEVDSKETEKNSTCIFDLLGGPFVHR
jgi:hypothetical protein